MSEYLILLIKNVILVIFWLVLGSLPSLEFEIWNLKQSFVSLKIVISVKSACSAKPALAITCSLAKSFCLWWVNHTPGSRSCFPQLAEFHSLVLQGGRPFSAPGTCLLWAAGGDVEVFTHLWVETNIWEELKVATVLNSKIFCCL